MIADALIERIRERFELLERGGQTLHPVISGNMLSGCTRRYFLDRFEDGGEERLIDMQTAHPVA